MLSDVEKDNNLILMRLNPVATLFGMLQGRKNEISLRNWSGGPEYLVWYHGAPKRGRCLRGS